MGELTALPRPLAGFKGLTSKGGEGKERRGGEGREGKGNGVRPPSRNLWIRPWAAVAAVVE